VLRQITAANVTPASIFRTIERHHPTVLLDELDTLLNDRGNPLSMALRNILNSAHNRRTAYVWRCEGEASEPRKFSTWSPIAVALQGGRLPPSLQDRAVEVAMKRKLTSTKIAAAPPRELVQELRRQCLRWATDHVEALSQARPQMPEMLHDRARDNWRLLLAIAELCGEGYADMAREAACELSAVGEDQNHAIILLGDLRALFERTENDRLVSTWIVNELVQMEDRPWPEFSRGKPITTRAMARLLEPFKIKPRQIRKSDGDRQKQGYLREQFDSAFKRYLPSIPPHSKPMSG
jgi:hypothetical protein